MLFIFLQEKKDKTPSLWFKMLWKLSKLKILCRITFATAAVQVMLVQTCSVKEKKEEEKILSDKYSFILCQLWNIFYKCAFGKYVATATTNKCGSK